ncbi:hypothetical protein W97_05928 [Coniosporium apollinis CBS 100218]|uniref:NTF2 domain-containing protein n=1 Tax=Coniosporium apollinis (strain CBS 100218) TaxID=1168221 RepID=R7YXQ9_CONA1|nr:uncharacterized protein W97_05928 [Coniosporium apollinis CBS 100218]EON66682.1 hypothetical protein W97_05928 [Coniosporium apollinis CBS 100218]
MAEIRADVLTKVSAEVAETFVDAYYTALQGSRNTISSYYTPRKTLSDGRIVPVIVWNGNHIPDAAAMQKMFEETMPYTYYDVQSLDCDFVNTGLAKEAATAANADVVSKKELEQHSPVVVIVGGYVRLEEAREGPMRGFSETFVLVPNEEKVAGKGKGKEGRAWLIQNQNFRYVV